jgi:carbamoylphosphate synthase large subunit
MLLSPTNSTAETAKDRMNTILFNSTTAVSVRHIINCCKVDGILLSCGGQSGFNSTLELYESGFFNEIKCKILG